VRSALPVDAHDDVVEDRSAGVLDPLEDLPSAISGALLTGEAREEDLELRAISHRPSPGLVFDAVMGLLHLVVGLYQRCDELGDGADLQVGL
jgi:hypothetical protein